MRQKLKNTWAVTMAKKKRRKFDELNFKKTCKIIEITAETSS